ncbi:MAG TPA: 2-oxo-tetronate isomerase [Dongiaceae bacterium]|jgi:hydroxypyruvate isomerase
MPKFAANLSFMFNEWDFLDRFAAASDAGFTAVEYLFPYDYPVEQIAQRLEKNGLRQVLFNIKAGDWAAGDRGLASLPERRSEFEASVDQALQYAEALKVPQVHVMAGLSSAKDPKAASAYRDSLKIACEKAARKKVTVLIEPINGRDMPGYFLNDFDLAAGIIDALKLDNLKLQFDIYHRQIVHGDVTVALEKLMPMIRHIQIASVPKRNEPGTGELDDNRIFALLDRLGYSGYVGCEYRPAGKTLDGLASWFTGAKRGA